MHVFLPGHCDKFCGIYSTCISILLYECRYRYYKDPKFVDYASFSDELESVFTTKGLEKTPTAAVEVFIPPDEVGVDPLTPEEADIMERTMQNLAERVSKTYHDGHKYCYSELP